MSDDFGNEVISVFGALPSDIERAESEDLRNYGPSVSEILRSRASPGKVLYFTAGRYSLDGGPGSECLIPSGCQLWFASGAVLRIDEGVTLRILGSLRAGNYQVFGFDRGQHVWRDRATSPPRGRPYGVGTAPLGSVVFDGDEVPVVRPEWWGAYAMQDGSSVVVPGYDSSDAFQAAIDAACVSRAGQSSIPIEVTGVYRCSRTLRVAATRSMCLVMRGTSALGGWPTLIRVRDDRLESSSSVFDPEVLVASRSALYLGPGVDFEIENMGFQGGEGADGCIEIACSERESLPRRGILRRVTLIGGSRFTVRIKESGAAPVRRQFVIDGCMLRPTSSVSSTNGIELRVSRRVMFHISNTVTGSSSLRGNQGNAPVARPLEPSATMLMEGGSVLIDSCQFQNPVGPRPSRESPDYDVPDGQEIFMLAPTQSDRSGTHLTCLHCESQGWWFLGRDSNTTDARSVVLINVSHSNPNWGLSDNRERATGWGATAADLMSPARPPGIVWNGSEGKLVLLSCRFRYTGVAITTPDAIVDVATVFQIDQRIGQRFLYRQGSLPQRPTFADPALSGGVGELSSNVPHVVPIVAELIRPRWP